MWTLINFLANFTIAVQVVYLFSCGQDYMRLTSRRGERSFKITRFASAVVAVCAICCALLYSRPPQVTEICGNLAVMMLFMTKCYSAYRYHVRSQRVRGTGRLRLQ